jgi:hypothetical protein
MSLKIVTLVESHLSMICPQTAHLRAAVEAMAFESPKLAVTAVLSEDDFASRLERAIERSGAAPKLIEGD